jgi:fumarate reductase subunit D
MRLRPHRNHPLWHAFVLHRLSGLGLVLFLPAHFHVLSLALTSREALDGALAWTEHVPVKIAEWGLVFLLSVHLFGGLRLLALEWLPWSPRQKTYAAAAAAVSFLVSTLFFLGAV